MKAYRSKYLATSAFALALVSNAEIAFAQADEVQPADSALETSNASAAGGEIFVTARRREERVQDVPVAVTSVTGEGLREQGIRDVVDLERTAPSLKFNQQLGGSTSQTVSLRGQAQADVLLNTDSSVGIYVDEVNVPRTINLRSTLFDIARIEVLRGPQGTLYGRNTTGGALSIISRAPDHDGFHGFTEASYGNYNAFEVGGALNIPLVEDRLAIRLAAQHRERDGYAHNQYTGREISDEDADFLRFSVLANPTDTLEIQWVSDWNKSKDNGFAAQLRTIGAPPFGTPTNVTSQLIDFSVFRGYLNPADIPRASNNFEAGPTFASGLIAGYANLSNFVTGQGIGFRDVAYGGQYPDGSTAPFNKVTNWGTGLRLSLDVGDVTLKSTTGYRKIDRASAMDLDGTPASTLHSVQETDADFFSQEFQIVGNAFDDAMVYQAGVYYSSEQGTELSGNVAVASINPANPTIALGDITNKSYAAYLQATYKVSPDFSVTAGGRYTIEKKELISRNRRANAATEDPNDFLCTVPPGDLPIEDCAGTIKGTFKDPSWLVSLDYKPSADVLLYAKASQSFRGGGTNLRAADARTFETFGPETAREYELGVKSDWFDRLLRLNVAGYLTKYSDIQRSGIVPTSTGGVTTSITNAASATIKGLEIEATMRPATGLTLSGVANFIDAKYDKFIDVDPATREPRDRSDDDFGTFNGIPRTQLSGSVRYETPVGDGLFAIQGNVYHQGKTPSLTIDLNPTFEDDDVNIAAYTLFSGRISYEFGSGIELAAYGENLTNKKYFSGNQELSSLGYLLSALGNPRTYGISLRVPFGAE